VIGLSSISEAFPYTAVEAMLAGRPIVATGVGGVAEAIGPAQCRGTALVVEPGDPGAMAEALLAVLGASSVERHHLGESLRSRALELFTARRMFDDYDDVYTSLFEQRSSAAPQTEAMAPTGAAVGSPGADRAMAHAAS
jgi:glycosyltransferase involved in cell wall biosynthesis